MSSGLKSELTRNKYVLYETAVQSADSQALFLKDVYQELTRGEARVLREDFRGTFKISYEWVKLDPRNRAIALDLDDEPLKHGLYHHNARLDPAQRKNLSIHKKDVRSVSSPKADVVAACNYSFNAIKGEESLSRYFDCVYKSLDTQGIFVLEMQGGAGMIEKTKERRRIQRQNQHWYTYIWDQQSFDPITREGRWTIGFVFPDGQKMLDTFVYDWRLWTIPELRYFLTGAGFEQTFVYWEGDDGRGGGNGLYKRVDRATSEYSWSAYIVAVKKRIKKLGPPIEL